MLDSLAEISKLLAAISDMESNITGTTTWQDVYIKFHRICQTLMHLPFVTAKPLD